MAKEVRLLALALVALLLAPGALAHIQGARPVLQRAERDRVVGLRAAEGMEMRAELALSGDPLRQYVEHTLDPTTGHFALEHRPDGSRDEERFHASWRIERLVEYRDQNVNGRYEPQVDAAVKAWRLSHYQWQAQPVRRAQVADVQGNYVVWTGNLTGSPKLRIESVIAGLGFVDEGAVVRPQDIILYIDVLDMPPRSLGALYALEATVTVQGDTVLSFHEAENTSTALLADAPGRRGLLVWGGEALLDDAEQRIEASLTEERVGDDGDRTAKLTWHLPTIDRSARFIMVSAVEYTTEDKRAPLPWLVPVLAALAVALLSAGGRRGLGRGGRGGAAPRERL